MDGMYFKRTVVNLCKSDADLMEAILGGYESLNEQIDSNLSKYFSNIGMKTEDVFDMIDYPDAYKDLYPNYSNSENEYEEDYYFESKELAYKDANDTLEFFNTLPNPIPIYRSLLVKTINDIDFDYLGQSWSFDKDSAISFAKNHTHGNALLIGKTNFDNVEWKDTIQLWYDFSQYYDDMNENEIRIRNSKEVFDVIVEKIK